jgi:hypothetical protein
VPRIAVAIDRFHPERFAMLDIAKRLPQYVHPIDQYVIIPPLGQIDREKPG